MYWHNVHRYIGYNMKYKHGPSIETWTINSLETLDIDFTQ